MKKIHKEIILVSVFLIFMIYAFSLWTFTGMIGKNQAKVIVRDFERSYLYQKTLSNSSYTALKEETFSGTFTSKKKVEKLMKTAFQLAGDQESQVFYIDILQGKIAKSKIETLKFEKKVINDVAYVKINVFNGKLISNFEKAVDGFEGKQKSIIIDLRGAKYGDMELAATVADEFIPFGKEICTLDGAVSKNLIKSDVFTYDFEKIYVFLDKDSGAPAEMLALALQQNITDKVVLVGNSSKQATTAFIDKNYSVHFGTSIALAKWSVNGYNSAAIQSVLIKSNYPAMERLEDYMKQVK